MILTFNTRYIPAMTGDPGVSIDPLETLRCFVETLGIAVIGLLGRGRRLPWIAISSPGNGVEQECSSVHSDCAPLPSQLLASIPRSPCAAINCDDRCPYYQQNTRLTWRRCVCGLFSHATPATAPRSISRRQGCCDGFCSDRPTNHSLDRFTH